VCNKNHNVLVAELVSSAECVHCSWSVLGEEAQ